MSKKDKSKDESTARKPHSIPVGGYWGILMAFVVLSIAYSTYVVAFGTIGLTPKLMLAPQAIFAAVVLLYKFGSK
jgi:hypothetical protein